MLKTRPDFWENPTVSMGLGPLQSVCQAWQGLVSKCCFGRFGGGVVEGLEALGMGGC